MQRDFEAAFHAAPHGVAIVGLDGTFLHVNQELAEIIGYSAEEMAAITFQEITHPDDLNADLAPGRRADSRRHQHLRNGESATTPRTAT